MKVSTLIEKLRKMPPDAEVWTYSGMHEEHDTAGRVDIVESQDDEAYDKCDKPSELGAAFPYVRIG